MRALPRVLCLAVAVLLGAPVASADPRSPAEARVALERQRARFAEALDRASWRRDDPSVRAVADEVTGEALGILDEVPSLDGEVRSLVREAAGAPLGPWLHQHATVGDTLLGAWLRGHDDPALLLTLTPHDPWSPLLIAEEVVFQRPALAADLVREGVRSSNPRLGDFCAVANALPEARRHELAMQAWQASHFELFGDCLALVASHPALRRDLAQRALAELTRSDATAAPAPPFPFPFHAPMFDDVAWPVAAAALTIPGIPSALAARLRAALTRRGDDLSWANAVALLARAAPWISADHPAVASVLADVERRTSGAPGSFGAFLRMLPVPSRARMATRVAGFVASLDAGGMQRATDDLVREVGLAAPRDASARPDVVRALALLRARSGVYAGRVSPRVIDAWIEAIERTARCADDACLRGLLRAATDETAARAAWLLGPRALATLPPDDAHALVQRLVIDRPTATPGVGAVRLVEPSALAVVVFGTSQSCPASLRGLASLALFRSTTDDDPLAPWRRVFAARCRDEARPRGAP